MDNTEIRFLFDKSFYTGPKSNMEEATGPIVAFLPCGHLAEYGPNHPRLYLATNVKGNLIRGSEECPICNSNVRPDLFAHICEP